MSETVTKHSRVETSKPVEKPTAKEPSLKGAFASVMILGGFLLLSWVLFFWLFLERQ